jgi:hypothetical protein
MLIFHSGNPLAELFSTASAAGMEHECPIFSGLWNMIIYPERLAKKHGYNVGPQAGIAKFH